MQHFPGAELLASPAPELPRTFVFFFVVGFLCFSHDVIVKLTRYSDFIGFDTEKPEFLEQMP